MLVVNCHCAAVWVVAAVLVVNCHCAGGCSCAGRCCWSAWCGGGGGVFKWIYSSVVQLVGVSHFKCTGQQNTVVILGLI